MSSKQDIFEAITYERIYQDETWGSVEVHPHEPMGWMLIMQYQLNKSIKYWMKGQHGKAMLGILKTITVGVACLEQHGLSMGDKPNE